MKVSGNKLTERQEQIFEFLRLYIAKNKIPPTRQEIATAFEFKSANAAQQHLVALASKGYIRLFAGGVSRGIVIV